MTEERSNSATSTGDFLEWVIPDQSDNPIKSTHLMNTITNAVCKNKIGGLCLILPIASGGEQLVAITSAIMKMRVDLDELEKSHEERTFIIGQRVKNIPDGFIYEVAGKAAEKIGSFFLEGYWLQRLDKKNGSSGGRFLIKKEDYYKFEPTTGKRPIGRDRSTWTQPIITPIDQLAGTKTYGNLSLQRNRVILIGSKTELESGLRSIQISSLGQLKSAEWPNLAKWIAWGGLDEDGMTYVESIGNTLGEPLLAATRDFQSVRNASNRADPGTLTFISSSVDASLRNLETVSRLAERHRFVLIVRGRDREKTSVFQKEGWQVWELSPDDILGPQSAIKPKLDFLNKNIDAAKAEKDLEIEFYPTSDENLKKCMGALRILGTEIQDLEKSEIIDNQINDLITELWDFFLLFCSWLRYPTSALIANYSDALARLDRQAKILKPIIPPEILECIQLSIISLQKFLDTGKGFESTPKGDALIDVLTSIKSDRLIVGGVKDLVPLRNFVDELNIGIKIEVAGTGNIFPNETVIAISLMARRAFEKFIDPIPASKLWLIGYDFECATYSARLRWRSNQRSARRIMSASHDDPASAVPAIKTDLITAPPKDEPLISGISRFEQGRRAQHIQLPDPLQAGDNTREGRLCIFEGCSWAIFTLGHSLSVVSSSTEKMIERKSVDDLIVGDRLIIREAGQKDAIHLLAEDKLGAAAYEQLWQSARRWRQALLKISHDPDEVWRKLWRGGLQRERLTIHSWLSDNSTIGPRNRDALRIIAEVADDQPDSINWEKCWKAINQLRGLHTQAGMRLGKLLAEESRELLDEDVSKEMAIDLSLGIVWLVQVREIHGSADWPQNIVNHLNWGDEAWQTRMLNNVVTVGV